MSLSASLDGSAKLHACALRRKHSQGSDAVGHHQRSSLRRFRLLLHTHHLCLGSWSAASLLTPNVPHAAAGIFGLRPTLGCYNFSDSLVPATFTRDTVGERLSLQAQSSRLPGMEPAQDCTVTCCGHSAQPQASSQAIACKLQNSHVHIHSGGLAAGFLSTNSP